MKGLSEAPASDNGYCEVGKNRVKTVKAGRLVCAVCYSQTTAADDRQARQAKQKVSSAARQLLNFRAAWQKLELTLAANFAWDDYFVTLTFDDKHLPPDRDASIAEVGKFMRALRAQRKHEGKELLYIYNVEEMPDEPGGEKRLHHHLFLNRAGDTPESLQALWGRGLVYVEPLLDGPNDSYEARARYFVKERHPGALGRKTGARAWIPSRNLKKPEVSSELVPESVTITAPPGAYVLDRDAKQNSYGAFVYIKYLLPEPKPKGRRRS